MFHLIFDLFECGGKKEIMLKWPKCDKNWAAAAFKSRFIGLRRSDNRNKVKENKRRGVKRKRGNKI